MGKYRINEIRTRLVEDEFNIDVISREIKINCRQI